MSISKNISLAEVVLERLKFGVRIPLSKEIYDNITLEELPIITSFLTEGIVLQFEGIFYGQWAEKRVVAKYPENWFEAVKERVRSLLPPSLAKRIKVKYHIVRIGGGVIFPQIPKDKEPFLKPVKVYKLDEDVWKE